MRLSLAISIGKVLALGCLIYPMFCASRSARAQTAPAFTGQPASFLVVAGSNATFRGTASGVPTPGFQWLFHGLPLSGATASGLTISNCQFANAGSYQLVASNSSGSVTSSVANLTVTVATGNPGFSLLFGSSGSAAGKFTTPTGIALDSASNIYVADFGNSRIQKFDSATNYLSQWGIAGSANGQFLNPRGLAVAPNGNIYVADTSNNRIQIFTNGSTFLKAWGTLGTGNGQFNAPWALAVSSNEVCVVDSTNNRVQIFGLDGTYQTQWGTNGTNAGQFSIPRGVAFDVEGNVYVTDTGNKRIQKFTSAGVFLKQWGTSGTGNGQFTSPRGICVDAGCNVYVTDTSNNNLQKFTCDGVFETVWGSTGSSPAFFNAPGFLTVDGTGNLLLVSDENNNRVQIFSYAVPPFITATPQNQISTISFFPKFSVSAIGAGPLYYQWFLNGTNLITGATNATYTVNGAQSSDAGSYTVVISNAFGAVTSSPPATLAISPSLVVSTLAGLSGTSGTSDGVGTNARFLFPSGLDLDAAGNIYIADSSNHEIRKLTPDGRVITIAGATSFGTNDGVGTVARFHNPNALAVDGSGKIFVADTGGLTVRMMTPSGTNWMVTTIAGNAAVAGTNDGVGTAALFTNPKCITVDSTGIVYVGEGTLHTIRKLVYSGGVWTVSTFAGKWGTAGSGNGTGTNATFNSPRYLTTDSARNIYVADWFNQQIRKITPAGVVSTLAGGAGSPGTVDASGTSARFNGPRGVSVDSAGNVYVADFFSCLIRKITPAGVVTTLAGTVGTAGTTDGSGSVAQVNQPCVIKCDPSGSIFYIMDTGNHSVRKAAYDIGQPFSLAEPLSITVPIDGSTNFGGGVFSATPSGYQWTLNGTPVENQTNAIFALTNTLLPQAGGYSLIASNLAGVTTNAIAVVSVVPLIITPQPVSLSLPAGTNAIFVAGAVLTGPFAYQWQLGGTNLTNNARISGTQTPSLSISNLSGADAGFYSVIVTNNYGSVTSATASLSVLGVPVSFKTGSGGSAFNGRQFNLQVTGLSAQGAVIIYASTNLQTWTPIYTNPSAFGTFNYLDTNASNYAVRYYRASVPSFP